MNLQSIGFKDDEWVQATEVSQVAYYAYPPDPRRHVIVSGKQRIVGADGVQSPNQYNNYDELQLFTDLPSKIAEIEEAFNETKKMPWAREDGEKRSVKAPATKCYL